MDWPSYEESFVGVEHRVLGRRLRPFCAYYQFWLQVVQSPLVCGQPATLGDLEIAVRICTSEYGEVERRIRPLGWFGRLAWWWRFFRAFLTGRDEFAAFVAYVQDWYALPKTRFQSEGAYEQFPSTLSLVCSLIKHTGWSPRRAWMLPLGQLHWYLQGFLRMEGVETGLITPHDEEFIAGIMRERAAKAAGKN